MPLWWWLWVVAVAVAVAVEMRTGYARVPLWPPVLVTTLLGSGYLVWLSRIRVRVAEGELWVGDAHLPVRFIGRIDVVTDATAKRRALGPELDPAAFVVHRGWVRPAVRLEVVDATDPTPYWVFSARRPQQLLAALGRAH